VTIAAAAFLCMRPRRRSLLIAPPSVDTALMDTARNDYAAYTGSIACKECHSNEYDAWARSHHALAERTVQLALDRPAFDPPSTIHAGSQSAQVHLEGPVPQIVADDLSGQSRSHAVRRVIGADPLRQFLVDGPSGRMQAMEAAYDPTRGDWFDVFGNEDRRPGEWGHWTGRGMNWNSMCAACHNTRLHKNYAEQDDSYHTQMAEMSVGCEACHGPSKAHSAWQLDHKLTDGLKQQAKPPDPTLPHLSRDQNLDTCASCHARRSSITGDFVPGQSFFDQFSLDGVDESETFYADGQVRDEDYEFSAFLGSKMYAAGVRCMDCHDVHSGRTLLAGNTLCMKCHTGAFPKAPVINPFTHTFHAPASAGSQCVNCHMPQTTYMQRHARHDHGFTIPDPLLTEKTNVPNACNRCHADKSADWAAAAVQQWYGAKMDRPSHQRAVAFAAARKGDGAARPALVAILADPGESFYWKSAAVRLLGRWANDSTVVSVLSEQLHAAHPLVRESGVTTLAPAVDHDPELRQAIQPLLSDPSRNVRVAAAQAMAGQIDSDSPAAREYLASLDEQADQPAGQFQLAVYQHNRGNPDSAIAHLERAVTWDQQSPSLHREAAVLFATLARPREALLQIELACRLDPENAEYELLHGLAAVEAGDPADGIEAMERAVRLDPHFSRAWYNIGLMKQKAGSFAEALAALKKAEEADGSDPQIPYARAVLLKQLHQTAEARAAAERALAISPRYQDAAELLQSLPR